MSDYCPFLCPICGNEMDGLRYAHNPVTNDSDVIVIDCEHCETLFQFHDSWDEVLTKLKYAYDPFPPDEIMQDAFVALADELDAQIMQEMADVWEAWEYIKEHGGGIYAQKVYLGEDAFLEEEGDVYFKGDNHLELAAAHIRKQGEP